MISVHCFIGLMNFSNHFLNLFCTSPRECRSRWVKSLRSQPNIGFRSQLENQWKCRPQKAPNNAFIFASFLDPKNIPLGSQLGAILALSFASRRPKRPPRFPPRGLPDRSWSQLGFQSRHKTAQEVSQPPSLGTFWARICKVGARFWRFLAPIFLTLLKFADFIFSATLALCWSTFFTRLWCWMGCGGYAKSQAFILFDLIRFEFYSLRGAPILEPKTTTKFWSSRGLQKFVVVLGSRVIDFSWLDSLWISLTSMLKYFLH